MNFYRLSIKSFKATKLFIVIIRYVQAMKESDGCVQIYIFINWSSNNLFPRIFILSRSYSQYH